MNTPHPRAYAVLAAFNDLSPKDKAWIRGRVSPWNPLGWIPRLRAFRAVNIARDTLRSEIRQSRKVSPTTLNVSTAIILQSAIGDLQDSGKHASADNLKVLLKNILGPVMPESVELS